MDFYTTTDEEKVEIIKSWLKKNLWYFVLAVSLVYISFAGYQYWEETKIKANQTASNYFERALLYKENENKAGLLEELHKLKKEFPKHSYTAMAHFLAAKIDRENAVAYFRFVIENTQGEDLTEIAKTRLARCLADLGKNQEAFAILDTVKGDLYKAEAFAVRGDILFNTSPREAKNHYLMALVLGKYGSNDRYSTINSKIQQLNAMLNEPEEITKSNDD